MPQAPSPTQRSPKPTDASSHRRRLSRSSGQSDGEMSWRQRPQPAPVSHVTLVRIVPPQFWPFRSQHWSSTFSMVYWEVQNASVTLPPEHCFRCAVSELTPYDLRSDNIAQGIPSPVLRPSGNAALRPVHFLGNV